MMKSFFKKLAFVMALAMVVTMAAPAAQKAVAADKALAVTYQNENHYSISEVNLANVGDKEDLKFLWAPSNWKELGVKWTSSNENVVTVDPNGVVTAVAAGTADVSVAVGTQTATVAVNVEELPAYTVSIGLGDERSVTEKELVVGESVDFAFYGIKDYSRDKVGALPRYLCTWQSDDTTVLSKDNDAGLFTAVKAGTAKVTLTVANVLTGQTHNVIPVAVTVKEPVIAVNDVVIVTGRNKTQNTVEVELPKDGSLGLDDIKIFRVFFADDDYNGDGKIDERDIDKPYESVYVNKVKGSAKNYVAETFDDFIDKATYEVQVTGYKAVRFEASVGDVAEVVVIEKDGASLATEDLELDPAHVEVKLYDANKVDVTTRYIDGIRNDDDSNVTFWLTDNTTMDYAMTDVKEISFYEMATAGVMATYDNNGKAVDSVDPCLITPKKANDYDIAEIVAWTLVAPGKKADWTKEVHDVPSGEYGYTIATLLKDTRGNYFTTHAGSVSVKYKDLEGVEHAVYYTEDEYAPFWIHGYRVEYRAMDPDKMLVEDYGDVASYEKGNARFALYLYDQFENADKEFVRELYSQYVNVCHPMKMTNMTATTAVSILTHTEYDENTGILNVDEPNAYYSKYSTGKIDVVLWDIHADTKAKAEHAAEADFEIQLITSKAANESEAQYKALKDMVEADWAYELNKTNGNERSISFGANDFAEIGCTKKQIKIKISEAVTKKSVTVTITLKTPELELDPTTTYTTDNSGKTVVDVPSYSAKVATIDEYSDILKIKLPFEKFVVNTKGFTVEQAISEYAKDNSIDGYEVLLEQIDRNGYTIGVDNNIFVANTLDVKKVSDVNTQAELIQGDRILIVKGPDGKIYPSALDTKDNQYNPNGTDQWVYGLYQNPAFTKKVPAGYEMPKYTTEMGVKVDLHNAYATSASGTSVAVNEYDFTFRAVAPTKELIYAQDGRYVVTIKTVKAVDYNRYLFVEDANGSYVFRDGLYVQDTPVQNEKTYSIKLDKDGYAVENPNYLKIEFTKSTGLTNTFSITVKNSNAQVSYAGRDLTRIEGAVNDYNWGGQYSYNSTTINAEYGDDPEVKKLILKAFNFKLGTGNWDAAAGDIMYYTYTLTPTNKQVVINEVVFKVPAEKAGKNTANGNAYGWYRSTAKVNKSLTFDYEY